jgi:hypothetical protein
MKDTKRRRAQKNVRKVQDMTFEEFTRITREIGIETMREIIRLVTSTRWPAEKIHRHVMARIDKQAAAKRKRAVKGGTR